MVSKYNSYCMEVGFFKSLKYGDGQIVEMLLQYTQPICEAEMADGGRSAAATNICSRGYEVVPSKTGRRHRDSEGTNRVCILSERDRGGRGFNGVRGTVLRYHQ